MEATKTSCSTVVRQDASGQQRRWLPRTRSKLQRIRSKSPRFSRKDQKVYQDPPHLQLAPWRVHHSIPPFPPNPWIHCTDLVIIWHSQQVVKQLCVRTHTQ